MEKRNRKKIWINSFVALGVVIAASIIFVLVSKKPAPVTAPPVSKSQIDLAQSKIVLNWLNTQRDGRGAYWTNYVCKETSSLVCGVKDASNYTGIPVMWGMTKYYDATRDQSILDIVKSDLKIYADDKKVPIVGTYNLTCKLIDDMLKESFWTSEEKQSLSKICFKTELISDRLSRNLSGHNEITLESLAPDINNKLLHITSNDREKGIASNYKQIIADEALDYYPYISSELLTLYKMSFNKDYLRRASYISDILLEDYINNKNMLPDLKCRIGRTLLDFNNYDFSNIINNPNYLKASEQILEDNKNTSAIDCAFLASEIYSTTKINGYKDYLKKRLVNNGGYNFLDTPEVKAFVFKVSNDGTTIELDKNALLVGLLSINEKL